MAVIWDPIKAANNFTKHGIRFADAVEALDDPYSITVIDSESDPEEERHVTIGADALGRILVLVYAYRGEDVRIISARSAMADEHEQYGRR